MKIEIPEVKKLVYEMRFPVRWGDMDAMGQLVIAGGHSMSLTIHR